MTPGAFIAKWQGNELSERAGAQTYFLDLCDLIGVEKPNDPDDYCFERGATKTGHGNGWADVWKRNCFAWENKGPHGDLSQALKQLMTYALALDNPPLLIVCNRQLIEIHTHFTGTPSLTHTIRLEDIGDPDNLRKLRRAFEEPEKFKPNRTTLDVTQEAAGRFADIAQSLQSRGYPPDNIAHFLIQCLFCMFAEDSGLLPGQLFQRIVNKSAGNPKKLTARLDELFKSMRAGGDFMLEDIAWFNGGLFEVIDPIPLEATEVKALLDASNMNWSQIEPSIFGTMFERGLDPAMRSQLGANYTDPNTIGKLIDPVIVRPLMAEWEATKAIIAAEIPKYAAGGKGSQIARRMAQESFLKFLERLKNFRVLDPACGSGNFLYLALRALKDIEHRANLDVEMLGLQRQITIDTSPANVVGIEINAYAAELARVTVWIGEIQWMLKNGYEIQRRPILAPLDHIQCRDAVLNVNWSEAVWPEADVIVGNPPFLGDKKMLGELGVEYVSHLRGVYKHRVPGGADLVTYWFEKARAQIEAGRCQRAGLVATQGIRKGVNRSVIDRIVLDQTIFEAWADEDWINDGAAVRVSLICWARVNPAATTLLDGAAVTRIVADLSDGGAGAISVDLSAAKPLLENEGVAFSGITKKGAFDIPREDALHMLAQSGNPNGRPNSDVLVRWVNGDGVTDRDPEKWLIDFREMPEAAAACYEAPFRHVVAAVQPKRLASGSPAEKRGWWRLARRAPAMFAAIEGLPRFLVTLETAKHRVFSWMHISLVPDKNLVVIARADDVTFGVLQSRFHLCWSLRLGSALEDRPRYTSSTTFRTYPFPEGLEPSLGPLQYANSHASAIAATAKALDELRKTWLNPTDWVDRVPEVVARYPDRIIAKPGHEKDLRKRTLTNLYNERPAWLDNAHKTLNAAVAQAYGWTDYTPDMPDEEILRRLLELNLQRASEQGSGL